MKTRATLSADILSSHGEVESASLDDIGASLEVMRPEEVPGPWDSPRSSFERPPMGLALRTSKAIRITLLDSGGKEIPVNPGMIGAFPDGGNIFYWPPDPALAETASLQLDVITDD